VEPKTPSTAKIRRRFKFEERVQNQPRSASEQFEDDFRFIDEEVEDASGFSQKEFSAVLLA